MCIHIYNYVSLQILTLDRIMPHIAKTFELAVDHSELQHYILFTVLIIILLCTIKMKGAANKQQCECAQKVKTSCY